MSEIRFILSSNSKVNDNYVNLLLVQLEARVTENEQILVINQIIDLYEERRYPTDIGQLLIEFFVKYASKKIIKKHLQNRICQTHIATKLITNALIDVRSNLAEQNLCYIDEFISLINLIYILHITNAQFYDDILVNCIPIYYMTSKAIALHAKCDFNETPTIIEKLFLLTNGICKEVLHIISKNDVLGKEYALKFAVLSFDMLKYAQIRFDLKTKLGLIFIYALNKLPDDLKVHFEYQQLPCLDIVKNIDKDIWFDVDGNQFDNILKNNENLTVIIYSALFNVLSANPNYYFTVQVFNKCILEFLFDELLEVAKSTTGSQAQVLEVSRTLALMSKNLKLIPKENIHKLYMEALQFVWSNIEHFSESVRNYARLLFNELIALAVLHTDLIGIIIANLKETSKLSSIRFMGFENIASEFGCNFLLAHFNNLQRELLRGTFHVEAGDQACKTYISLMQTHAKEIDVDTWAKIWVQPVADLIRQEPNISLDNQKNIIFSAFKENPAALSAIYPPNYIGNTQESIIILKGLQLARKTNQSNDDLNNDYWRGLISKSYLDYFKIHQNDDIRISSLAVIVECQKSTELFTEWELNFLLSHLNYNLNSQSPSVRKQIVTYYTKALARFNASYYVITRSLSNLAKKQLVTQSVEIPNETAQFELKKNFYNNFLTNFVKILIANLAGDANYFRRSSSLQLLLISYENMSKELFQECWTEDDICNCRNILYDSYESNKKLAVDVLVKFPAELIWFESKDSKQDFLNLSLEMATDIKPSKTLSAAYMFELYTKSDKNSSILSTLIVLMQRLKELDREIDVTTSKTAHYGVILSIKHLLQKRDFKKENAPCCKVFTELVQICFSIQKNIMPIVCNSAPEGYLPNSNEDEMEIDESPKSQMILVYAWRTIKEMTLLLAEIVRQTIKVEHEFKMLPVKYLIAIGQLFVEIFIESKHRGVFEQAYVGFAVICEKFWSSSNARVNILPKKWLDEALCLCTGKKLSGKLCATRRSAGLPFMILSILTTESTFDKPNFHFAIKVLIQTCKNLEPNNNEYRMHCMNILRALYRHSKLGELVSSYVAQGVIIAITGFKSASWTVRNSATLLYSALMTRIFGVQRTHDSEDVGMKNRLTLRVFFMRYPELFDFLRETLANECEKSDSLVLHPVLMILTRLYPSHIEEHNTQIQEYVPYIRTCLANCVYRTRELAARASVPLVSDDVVEQFLELAFYGVGDGNGGVTENELHGILLQISHLIRSNNLSKSSLNNYLPKSIALLNKDHSNMVLSLYMEVIFDFLIKFKHFNDTNVLKALLLRILGIIPLNNVGAVQLQENRFNLIISILNRFNFDDSLLKVILVDEIINNWSIDDGRNLQLQNYYLNFLIGLNQINSDPKHKQALYLTQDLEIPEQTVALIRSLKLNFINQILSILHSDLTQIITNKLMNYSNEKLLLPILLLARYFPCLLNKYPPEKTLDLFLEIINSKSDEEITCAAISCISTCLTPPVPDSLIRVLMESASPAAADYRRLAVCELLCNNQQTLFGFGTEVDEDIFCKIFNISMVLLEDDDVDVRNAMSNLAIIKKDDVKFESILPEKSKEFLLHYAADNLENSRAVCLIFSWACRHFPDFSFDDSEIFERGELNLFADNIPIRPTCISLLRKLLKVDEDMDAAVVNLRIALEKYPSDMMAIKTEFAIINGLEEFGIGNGLKYLEGVEPSDFQTVKIIISSIFKR